MNELKQGDLVKAWIAKKDSYLIGIYREFDAFWERHIVDMCNGDVGFLANATKIPDELARQLKELK